MKILSLVRHAKSSWSDSSATDFDRPLNGRGERDAPVMGGRLAEKDPPPDLLVASPAHRAATTAQIIAEELEYSDSEIRWEPAIYEAGLNDLMEIINGLNDDLTHVMLIGHNPGFTDLANHLANAHIDNVPTCGAVRIEFDVESWAQVDRLDGELVDFDYPKKTDS